MCSLADNIENRRAATSTPSADRELALMKELEERDGLVRFDQDVLPVSQSPKRLNGHSAHPDRTAVSRAGLPSTCHWTKGSADPDRSYWVSGSTVDTTFISKTSNRSCGLLVPSGKR